MKTLIIITRETRFERPSESTIQADSDAIVTGTAPSQDQTKDNFFVITGDPVKHAIRLLSINAENPYGRSAGDGVAFYSYSHSSKITNATELRARDSFDFENNPIVITSKAFVQYTTSDSGGTNEYDTLEAAQTFIASLQPSDGYNLLDEGFGTTQVIETRPSLWPSSDDIQIGVSYDLDISVKTSHTRTDADRY
tara:strand:- start:287 stop:871 length:585 start_codon:yes stop_codon:yes gene_type:complete